MARSNCLMNLADRVVHEHFGFSFDMFSRAASAMTAVNAAWFTD